jgi:hypothetical protein
MGKPASAGRASAGREPNRKDYHMIILGLICLIIGFLIGVPVLWSIGVILVIAGAILWLLGSSGREIGGRRHYY